MESRNLSASDPVASVPPSRYCMYLGRTGLGAAAAFSLPLVIAGGSA